MRWKIIKAITLTIMMCFSTSVNATITDVSIVPSLPTPLDVIFINVLGQESSGPVFIEDTDFRQDGMSLELDISLDVGAFLVITPWSHTENIGTLPAGVYDLTVNTIVELEPFRNDTSFTRFEVVPEPGTLVLFGLGGLFTKNYINQKIT